MSLGISNQPKTNLGSFVDSASLIKEQPKGDYGQYAFIEETGSYWIWDLVTGAWIDSGLANAPATEETLQSVAGLNIPKYDAGSVAYPNSVTEVYTFREGGLAGTVVAEVTIVYTDSTKKYLSSFVKV